MKWLKWFVLLSTLLSDIWLLAANIICCYYFPILGVILVLLTYKTWRNLGGFSNWKLSTMRCFLRNWEEL